MQTWNATAASFAQTSIVKGDYDGGTMIFPGNPRSHNPNDTLVPATCTHHNGCITDGVTSRFDLLLRRGERLFLDLLSFTILPVEKFSQHRGLGILRRYQ